MSPVQPASLNWQGRVWDGQIDQFKVASGGVLELDTEGAGEAYIYTDRPMASEVHWDIGFSMDFDPSNSNFIQLFLSLDTYDLEHANGHFLRIGASGTPDAVEFYALEDGEAIFIASSIPNYKAGALIHLRIQYLRSQWHIYQEDQFGNPVLILEINESTVGNKMALKCTFTSSRNDGFTIHRMNSYEIVPDHSPPIIDTVFAPIPGLIRVCFNEEIELSGHRCQIDGVAVDTLYRSLSWNCLEVGTALIFENPSHRTIWLTGIADTSGNSIGILSTEFTYAPRVHPAPGELVVNEIMFDPVSGGAQYIELWCNTQKYLQLEPVSLILYGSTGIDSVELADLELNFQPEPWSYVVLTRDTEVVKARFSSHDAHALYQCELPLMDRSSGRIELIDNHLQRIDIVKFDKDFHLPMISDKRGKALERITYSIGDHGQAFWASAASTVGWGTPGKLNSQLTLANYRNAQIRLTTNMILPEPDGHLDIILIEFGRLAPGYVARGQIYDFSGRVIHTSLPQSIGANSTISVWNGTTEEGKLAPPGLYILLITMYNPLDREKIVHKEVVLLAASE